MNLTWMCIGTGSHIVDVYIKCNELFLYDCLQMQWPDRRTRQQKVSLTLR